MEEMTAEEVRTLYEKKIGDSDMPRHGAFGREMVKALLDRIDELEEQLADLQDAALDHVQRDSKRRRAGEVRAKKHRGGKDEEPGSRDSVSIEDVLPPDKVREASKHPLPEKATHQEDASPEGVIGEESDV